MNLAVGFDLPLENASTAPETPLEAVLGFQASPGSGPALLQLFLLFTNPLPVLSCPIF